MMLSYLGGEMDPTYEDYMKEATEKLAPLLDALDKKSPMDFLQFTESHVSETKVATTLLNLAWKVKPTNQEPSDTVHFVFLYVVVLIASKNFKGAHQWADFAAKSYPNEETSWMSKLMCGHFEAVDWVVKAQNKKTWETGVMESGWLGLAIGAGSLNQKQKQFAEQMAYPALMLAQMDWNKLRGAEMDFESFLSEVRYITEHLEYTKDTRYWSQAIRILNNLMAIDWNRFGDKADQDKIKKLQIDLRVILSSK